MQLDHIKDLKIQGFGKFFHRIFLFLTYPLRHIFKFFAYSFVLAVIFMVIPMSQGVDHKNVLTWYRHGFENLIKELPHKTEEISTQVVPQQKNEHHFKEVAAPSVVRKKVEQNRQENNHRRAFKTPENPKIKTLQAKEENLSPRRVRRAKKSAALTHSIGSDLKDDTLQKQDSLKDYTKTKETLAQQQTIASADLTTTPDSQPADTNKPSYYRIDKSLPLVYEQDPKEITGKALVFTPNEISVNKTYMYLYGIYTNPSKYDMKKALEYLRTLADGKKLTCKIVAYTRRHIATGVCFLDSMSINQSLVDAGFADNVAL